MAQTTEAYRNQSNHSHVALELGGGLILPKSPMPAWVPAVSVAIAMLIFLTISFYIRHRKVLKKRQILMDYFYIIFQYGGLRRKRMVTALCNTNAITLSHLGRSFMISFDNNDNSCPFFMDDTAFTKPNNTFHSHSNGLSKTKNKLKIPFRRVMSQVEGNSVNEMLMKFKPKKKSSNSSSRNKNKLAPPRRSSLSSIHDDEPEYTVRSDFETTPRFKQRRNAYVVRRSETETSSTMEMCSESDDPELSNIFIEHNRSRRASSIRRKSHVYHRVDTEEDGLRVISPNAPNLRVLKLGSSSSRKQNQNSFHQLSQGKQIGSKKEPLILIQTASTDFSSSQDSDDIPAHCSKGVVVLRRVSRDCPTGEEMYAGDNPVNFNQRKRASLSTVSYVQSSNVNDYYQHCLHSPKLSEDEFGEDRFSFEDEKQPSSSKFKSGRGWRKGVNKKSSPQKTVGSTHNKRSRLSLGDIGVGNFNFNRRFEESLGSMQEQDSEGSFSKLSKELSDEKNKPSSTWRRLKNVFTGIRWSGSSGSKLRQSKSSMSEDRVKIKNRRNISNNRKWNRFVSALTGNRSLQDEKKYHHSPGGPKGSKSLPMGLDRHSITVDDLEFHLAMAAELKHKKRNIKHSSSKCDVINDNNNRKVPPKTRSFPDNIYFFQDPKTKPCLFHLKSDPTGTAPHQKLSGRKHKRRNERSEDHSKCHSISNIDFLHSPSHLSSFADADNKTFYFRSGSPSRRSKSPLGRKQDRRYRSLSPLPERHKFTSSPRKEKNVRWYSHSERNSLSERGVPMSPSVRFNLGGETDFLFPSKIVKGHSLGNVNLNSSCIEDSNEDLSKTPLLEAQHNHQSEDTKPVTADYITIDMEPCIETGQDSISINSVARENNAKDECCSLKSDSLETSIDYHSFESPSKSSQPTHEKSNNSSLDSIYFDSFSVPGSPMITFRSPNALKQLAASQHLATASDFKYTTTTSLTTQSPSSLVNLSLLPPNTQMSHFSGIVVRTDASLGNNSIPSSSPSPCTSELQTNTNMSTKTNLLYPTQSITGSHEQKDNSSFAVSIDSLPKQASSSASQLTASLDKNLTESPEDSLLCTNNISEETKLLDDSSPQTNLLIQSNIPKVSCLRQSTLEKQESITSDEEMMNLTRLPRFGRRSSQCASPLLAGIRRQQKNKIDESSQIETPSP